MTQEIGWQIFNEKINFIENLSRIKWTLDLFSARRFIKKKREIVRLKKLNELIHKS